MPENRTLVFGSCTYKLIFGSIDKAARSLSVAHFSALETTPMTKKLDLVLINPSSRTQVYQSLGTKLAAIENPVWAGLMATYCRRAGLSVEIIDAEASELCPTEVAERIEDLDPTLTAVVAYGHQPSA